MLISVGQPLGLCACGCGGIVYEKIYHYEYRGDTPVRRQPKFLMGHSKPPEHWAPRSDMVPSEPIWRFLVRFKKEHGLTWSVITRLVEYNYPIKQIKYRGYVSKANAEKILRAIRKYHLEHTA